MPASSKLLTLIASLALGTLFCGCNLQQQPAPLPPLATTPPHALPFKGHLAEGDAADVPPAVAMSLAADSPVTFTYREELTHDEYHIPLYVSWLDPVTLFGGPLGDYGVTAFASLSITDGDRIIGDYTAKAYVSKQYSMYSEPTHKDLEDAARAEVRERIDQKLYRDEARLRSAFSSGHQPVASPLTE
jgi:hypothetical protein